MKTADVFIGQRVIVRGTANFVPQRAGALATVVAPERDKCWVLVFDDGVVQVFNAFWFEPATTAARGDPS